MGWYQRRVHGELTLSSACVYNTSRLKHLNIRMRTGFALVCLMALGSSQAARQLRGKAIQEQERGERSLLNTFPFNANPDQQHHAHHEHHFFTTGFFTFLGLVLDLVHTSLGTSTHSSRLELRHQLGHMGTGSLRLKGALLLGGILDNSLGLVITDFSTLLESTASRGTQLPRLLGTSSDGGILLDTLLLNVALRLI